MPNIEFPICGLNEDRWKALPFPERVLMVMAHLTDSVGVCEDPKGSNRGPWIDKFLTSSGTLVGQPWCAAFVTYACQFSGWDPIKHGIQHPAAVASWRTWAKANGRWKSSPERGRLFVLASSHIGAVTGLTPTHVQTLEGNTNDEGSREGYEACRRNRKIATIEGFIDLDGLA